MGSLLIMIFLLLGVAFTYTISCLIVCIFRFLKKNNPIFSTIFALFVAILLVGTFFIANAMSRCSIHISEQECRAILITWCHGCLVSGWPDDIMSPSDVVECMSKYYDCSPEKYDCVFETTACSNAKSICKQFGVE
jgi:hypothetical protein